MQAGKIVDFGRFGRVLLIRENEKGMLKMKISVIIGHPDPNSFNHAIALAASERLSADGHTVWYHDLYQERFDPLLYAEEFGQEARLPFLVDEHCCQIARADGIVIVHPNWWGQPPAIVKGWIDRVIRPGVAYRFEEGDSGEGVPVGLLAAKTAVVFNTSNTSDQREMNVFGDPLERIWKDCVFGLCGVRQFTRRMFRVVVTSMPQQRRQWLEEVRDMMRNYFPPQV
jgi:NAD(P)H dehydrogenase (quinone)